MELKKSLTVNSFLNNILTLKFGHHNPGPLLMHQSANTIVTDAVGQFLSSKMLRSNF